MFSDKNATRGGIHNKIYQCQIFHSNITQIFISQYFIERFNITLLQAIYDKKFAEMIYAFVDRMSIGQAKNTTLNFTTFSNGHIFQRANFVDCRLSLHMRYPIF